MKNLYRYIILSLLFAVAFICNANTPVSDMGGANEVECGVVTCYLDSSESDSNLFIPRQSSSANVLRLHSTVKRTNSGCKNNVEFVKVGKLINADVKNFIQRESLLTCSMLVKPFLRLISMGKLII